MNLFEKGKNSREDSQFSVMHGHLSWYLYNLSLSCPQLQMPHWLNSVTQLVSELFVMVLSVSHSCPTPHFKLWKLWACFGVCQTSVEFPVFSPLLTDCVHFYFVFWMNIYLCLNTHSVTLRKLLPVLVFIIYVFSFPSFQGLTYKKLNRLDEALDCFLKLHAILRNSAQVLYQIANVYLPLRTVSLIHSAGDWVPLTR